MKAIILAAGYGTRLYPLTKIYAKPLLPVDSKPVLEYLLDKIEPVKVVDKIYIVANNKFFQDFERWKSDLDFPKAIDLINDGTNSNDERLGAIKDLQFAVKQKSIIDDALVLGGDNIFLFSFVEFVEFFNQKQSDSITVHELNELEKLCRTGVVEIDENDRVVGFEEKPAKPKSNLASPPCYIFTRKTLNDIGRYLSAGNNPDAPGNFIRWLYREKEVHAFRFYQERYDIGNLESYQRVSEVFQNIKSRS